MISQGIQSQDVIPQELFKLYEDLFDDYFPGLSNTGQYNYSASPSTQLASVQLNKLLHSGSHPIGYCIDHFRFGAGGSNGFRQYRAAG